jgi:hypothetical protein
VRIKLRTNYGRLREDRDCRCTQSVPEAPYRFGWESGEADCAASSTERANGKSKRRYILTRARRGTFNVSQLVWSQIARIADSVDRKMQLVQRREIIIWKADGLLALNDQSMEFGMIVESQIPVVAMRPDRACPVIAERLQFIKGPKSSWTTQAGSMAVACLGHQRSFRLAEASTTALICWAFRHRSDAS